MMAIEDVTIDPEFASLLPLQTAAEAEEFLKSVEADGFREPLVVWLNHGILLDGHHRFRLWQEFYRDDPDRCPEIVEKAFRSRQAAMEWVIRNQLGRRNLSDIDRIKLAKELEKMLKAQGKANMSKGGKGGLAEGRSTLTNLDDKVHTRDQAAKSAGVSGGTYSKGKAVLKAVESGELPAETVNNIREGKTSINKAHGALKAKAKQSYVVTKTEPTEPPEMLQFQVTHKGPPTEKELLATQRSKTVKTCEALMRAFDELQALKRKRCHKQALDTCKELLQLAKDWK